MGAVSVSGVVLVPEGVTLTIAPGAVVSFLKSEKSYAEPGGEGAGSEVLIPGSGIRVEGKVVALGDRAGRITFTSAGKTPVPGDWGCIFLDHSKGSVFRYCRFEFSAYTIHAHFSQFDVSRSVITHNEDGSRLGLTRASFDHCDIMDNTGKGLNFRQCRATVTHCNITGNRDGVFLNEKDTACVIEDDNIRDNLGMDLRLGEFHADDVTLKGDWWGSADPKTIAAKVYDREDDPAIGRAVITPAPAEVPGAGVDGAEFKVKWKFKTGGFVDASPAVADGVVYFGSWDKGFYAVKAETGELVWKFQAGDCVDSSPAVARGKVCFGSWDRNIYCLNAKDGGLAWKFEMPPSNFDDHRQSSPTVSEGVVYVGGFGGSVYALGLPAGNEIGSFRTGGAVRSRPGLGRVLGVKRASGQCVKYRQVLAGSADSKLYSIDPVSGPDWSFTTGGAVNSSPAVDKGAVYFGSRDGRLYRLSIYDGDRLWSYDTGSRIEYSSPLLAGKAVIIGDCAGTLHAVDRETGKAIWKFPGGGGIYSSAVLSGGRVFYGDNAGNVYCINPADGRPAAAFRVGDAVQGITAGPDGTIYAGSRDGFLYALSLE